MDYGQYHLSVQKKAVLIVAAGAACFALGYLFYKHFLPAALFATAGCIFPRIWTQMKIRKRKEALKRQFKQALHILSSALASGKSVENAFEDSLTDLKLLYPSDQIDIVKEWQRILQRIRNGDSLEAALSDFARRSQLEDIQQFTEVFLICKRSGGNMVDVIQQTAQILGEKMETQQEIEVMLARKKFESRMIFLFPLCLIVLLSLGSPEYMRPLYEGAGRVVMTIALGILLLSCWMHVRMMRIEL